MNTHSSAPGAMLAAIVGLGESFLVAAILVHLI